MIAGALALSACSSDDVSPDADGNYVGVVTSVREDELEMDVDSGGSMRVDTFAVCGDRTPAFISVGDRLTITADRETVGFDAITILDEAGQPACEEPAGDAGATDGDGGSTDGDTGGTDGETAAGTVTLQEAEEAALAAVGEGRVTFSGPEDDRGAAWEIEVTRDDGSEIDVLVAPDGSIIDQIER